MAGAGLDTDGSFWRTLGRQASLVDGLLLGSVPLAILGVYWLPTPTRESLVFQYTDPSLQTAFLAPFVHFSPSHLLFNLVGYALIVVILYALSLAADNSQEFRVVFVALLVSSPVLLSYLNLTIVRGGATFGFSGVLMAYYGYLPFVLAKHTASRLDIGEAVITAPLLFFFGLTLVTVQTLRAVLANPVTVAVDGVPASVTWVLVATLAELVVLLVLVMGIYATYVAGGQNSVRETLRTTVEKTGHFELAVVATVVFVAIPFLTFPIDPIAGQRVFNLYVHFVGYALGFIATYVYHML